MEHKLNKNANFHCKAILLLAFLVLAGCAVKGPSAPVQNLKTACFNCDSTADDINEYLKQSGMPFHYTEEIIENQGYSYTLTYQDSIVAWNATNFPEYITSLSSFELGEHTLYQIDLSEDVVGCSKCVIVIPGMGIFTSDIYNCDYCPCHFEDYAVTDDAVTIKVKYEESEDCEDEPLKLSLTQKL